MHLARLPRVERAHESLGLAFHRRWFTDKGCHAGDVVPAQARFFVPEFAVAPPQPKLGSAEAVLELACMCVFFCFVKWKL
jgi:hypothetical protein